MITGLLGSLRRLQTAIDALSGGGDEGEADFTFISEGPSVAWSTTPVPYFDVALPTGYVEFMFRLHNVCLDADDDNGSGNGLAFQLSRDGGTTWVFDGDHTDAYVAEIDGSSGLLSNYPLKAAPKAQSWHIHLWPGDSVVVPHLMSEWTNAWDASHFNNSVISSALNPAATVAPTIARYNKIRLFPFKNNGNPPASTRTFVHGTWELFGYAG